MNSEEISRKDLDMLKVQHTIGHFVPIGKKCYREGYKATPSLLMSLDIAGAEKAQ
jgi:hypothetical protein